MRLAILSGAVTGLGCIGLLCGLRLSPPSLDAVAAAVNRPLPKGSILDGSETMSLRAGRTMVAHLDRSGIRALSRWPDFASCLAITGLSPERLATHVLVFGGAGLLAPPFLWVVAQLIGVSTPVEVPILIALLGVSGGLVLPVVELFKQARERRRHFRIVIGSFVDLVVLGLAGGVGVEGAMFAASQVSSDWAARRMARALLKARDSGESPWIALGQLGETIDVPELVELSTTLQLAGTEGARIRQSLSARAVSIRRHEQADAESAANATTERLFLPGSLLLLGFLLFVGYPAFSRILSGF
jgi:tight adherence protein C